MIKNLNTEQKKALKILLNSKQNIFLSGAAGTGKSYVLKVYREILKAQNISIPVVASTGAAALLVNGVTFNSYFGLGIMHGEQEDIVEKAMHNRHVCERIVYADTIIVDEVSMISGEVLEAANILCQRIRKNKKFFGGIRMLFVGDFYQLGPFSEIQKPDWCFLSKAWKSGKIKNIELKKIMRTNEKVFLNVLAKVRKGKIDSGVKKFLDIHKSKKTMDDSIPRIFSRNFDVDKYNLEKLSKIANPLFESKTLFVGEPNFVQRLKDSLVIGESVKVKKGALVMTRINNMNEGYINGTVGIVVGISPDVLTILKPDKSLIQVKKHIFEFLSSSGEVVAKAKNFPVTLAWAITITKSQGASLDRAIVDLDRLWMHGQAYTALSRLTSSKGLYISKYDKKSFIVDKKILKFFK